MPLQLGPSSSPKIIDLIWRVISLAYGFASLGFWGITAVLEGHLFKRPSEAFWAEVDKERRRLWDLSQSPHPGFHHAFEELETGQRLHYLTNNDSSGGAVEKGRKLVPPGDVFLVIFIHGFPDTSLLWLDVMTQLDKASLTDVKTKPSLVAVDLPGFGGSQGLSNYGPDELLDCLCQFICSMRERYVDDAATGKVVVVAHDWGALCGFRLAVDAQGIADRFILANTMFVEAAKDNLRRRLNATKTLLGAWLANPLDLRLLGAAASALWPIIDQAIKSSYIFQFNLPAPIVRRFGGLANAWFLYRVNSIRFHRGMGAARPGTDPSPSTKALGSPGASMAASIGPNTAACMTRLLPSDGDGGTFDVSVRHRAKHINAAFFENVRLYREGLATKTWTPSEATRARLAWLPASRRSSTDGRVFEDIPPGAACAPVTLVWGAQDPALNYALVADGLGRYIKLVRHGAASHVVMLPRVGHWVPAEPDGVEVLAKVTAWSIWGEGDESEGVKNVALGAWLNGEVAQGTAWQLLLDK